MDNSDFKNYLEMFEKQVVVKGIECGLLGKNMMVPIRNGRLATTEFGKMLGSTFLYDDPAAIDYYGFIKKSSGMVSKYAESSIMQVSAVRAPIVHFASIKVENVSDLSSELVKDFPEFKKVLVALRNFKRKDKRGGSDASDRADE